MILFCGFFASFPFGYIAWKTGKFTLLCKICGIFVVIFLALISYFMRFPGMGPWIVFSCAGLGIFALGAYPLALELVVECTYPVDQATTTAFIFLSSALQGVLLMEVENYLGTPLTDEEMLIQTCVSPDDHGHAQPKHYGSYLNFLAIYTIIISLIFMVFFRTDMKRTLADTEVNRRSSSDNHDVEATRKMVMEQ